MSMTPTPATETSRLRAPPLQGLIPVNLAPWDALKFTPDGARNIHRYLGVLGQIEGSRDRFFASDIAYLASGASMDDGHMISPDEFFPELHDLYSSLPRGAEGQNARKVWEGRIRQLVFDLCTKWDRCMGGTTMVMHVAGTTVPGAPLVPERLKAQVYIPPHFLDENHGAHAPVASIVQQFIEAVGIPTAAAWKRHGLKIWSMSQHGIVPRVVLPTRLIPLPVSPGAAHYIFHGRPAGHLPPPVIGVSTPAAATVDEEVYDIEELTQDDTDIQLFVALEQVNELRAQVSTLHETITLLQDEVEALKIKLADRERMSEAELDDLAKTAADLQRELGATQVSFKMHASPTTPPRQAPPAYPMSPSPHSPWRGPASARADLTSQLTDAFLESRGLLPLVEAVQLIFRIVSPFHWGPELARLPGIPPEAMDGLLDAMDADRRAQ
ncbi:hypothetical protein B0H15DRAFT_949911 [Mycena belliarum]|uniref:Uncharacterized protein n=1 Tax=Mycena belliarum TaxID=1033014 RepID=A0AAD6XQK9_9AGAR|nr:hypothetical protein B0H15DRAFT_949911 [Mycena belliae]